MATLLNQKLLKSCVEKFNFPDSNKRQRIDEIISAWQTAFKDHDLARAKETSLQGKFFSKFFCEILGYTMQDDGTDVWTLKQEAKTEVDGKEADGSLGYYSKTSAKTRCVIELKDAQCNLDSKQQSRESKQTPVEQAFQYLYKFADCDWVIVSNFRYTRLYHKSKGQTAYEEFDILNLHEEKEFKRFYYCLCKENLLNEQANSPMDLLIKQSGEADIDITKEFYAEFKTVRKILFEHIVNNNPDFDKKLLLEKTQKLLDRFIFIFFCEDTAGLLPHNTVENIYKMAQNSFSLSECKIWEQFRGLFVAIDKGNNNVNPPINAYNGGLFTYDDILDKLIIKDEMFTHIKELARYDFESDLNVNILGHIFEQSLSDLEQIKNELDGIQEDKKNSKRKKDGIFYTPEYITHYIVEETIGKYLEENPDKLETIKILDPACGSGAFLNQAHSFLLKQRQIQVEENIKNSDKSQLNLFKHTNQAEHDRSILLNNLFGVDLNKESVEITKLALWLKTANSKCKLNNLDENIKCGNSLIDDETIAGDKAFKWETEYKDIMQNGGFDVIIGNPPYGAELSDNDKNFCLDKYKLKSSESALLFIKLAYDLLNDNGLMGFIIPKSFCFSSNYKTIREYVFNDIETIVDCSKVWKEVKLEQVIIIIKKGLKANKYNSLVLKQNNFIPLGQINKDDCKKFNLFLNGVSSKEIELANKILYNSFSLNDISTNQRGIILNKFDNGDLFAIGGNEIDRYKIRSIRGKISSNKIKDDKAHIKDNSILVQGIVAHIENPIDHIKITAVIPQNKEYIIVDNLNQIIISAEYSKYPIWCLLNSTLINWYSYRFIYGKSIRTMRFDNPVTARIPIANKLKENEQFFIDSAIKIIEKHNIVCDETTKAIELITLEYKPKKISQKLETFYTLGLNPLIEELEKQGVKLSLTQKEDLISWYKTKSDQLNKIKSEIDTLDRQIDQEVYKLYNLTPEEIQIIEGVG